MNVMARWTWTHTVLESVQRSRSVYRGTTHEMECKHRANKLCVDILHFYHFSNIIISQSINYENCNIPQTFYVVVAAVGWLTNWAALSMQYNTRGLIGGDTTAFSHVRANYRAPIMDTYHIYIWAIYTYWASIRPNVHCINSMNVKVDVHSVQCSAKYPSRKLARVKWST